MKQKFIPKGLKEAVMHSWSAGLIKSLIHYDKVATVI